MILMKGTNISAVYVFHQKKKKRNPERDFQLMTHFSNVLVCFLRIGQTFETSPQTSNQLEGFTDWLFFYQTD